MSTDVQVEALAPATARRVFLVLAFTRWFPVGLVVGIMTLWQLERGLTITEAALTVSFSGVAVFFLELPTSGFADAFGRRPVYVASAVVQVIGCVAFLLADSFATFAVAAILFGVFRALDSGPLEAWYVDTVHATEPGADVDGALSTQGAVVGVGIGLGALVSGGLIWWHPVGGHTALWLPVVVYSVLTAVHLVVVLVMMHEPGSVEHLDRTGLQRAAASARQAPVVIREGVGMLRTNRVLRGLILAGATLSVAMVIFEMFQPVRLAELLGSEEAAGAWMGPIAAAGWGIFAAGSALAGRASKRLGVVHTAMLGRLLNSLGAIAMGVVAGPVALVAAYAFTYSMHGFAGPMHSALLHREAQARNRATVLSIQSMSMFATFSVAAFLIGLLAERSSTQLAMAVGGAVSLLGLLCYLPARRAERLERHQP